jgi:hypothetical protein
MTTTKRNIVDVASDLIDCDNACLSGTMTGRDYFSKCEVLHSELAKLIITAGPEAMVATVPS